MRWLREYAEQRSEQAFSALVSRHIHLVHSVALRQMRDPHLAEEVTQTVFLILARKAGSLGPDTVLAGWLCRTARNVAANLQTVRRRRLEHEHEAHMHAEGNEPEDRAWTQIAPLLDSGLARLGEKDHSAIVLRFLEGRNFREVGAAIGTSEDGAKKRVSRALERLRDHFRRQGVSLSGDLIAGALSLHSVSPAPDGLAPAVTAAALKGAAIALPAQSPAFTKLILKLMASTKLKTAAIVGSLILLGTGSAFVAIHHHDLFPPRPVTGFAGYATPEAAVQSMIWSGSQGDFPGYLAGCTPEQAERLRRKVAGKSPDEVSKEAMAWARSLTGYSVTFREEIDDDEVHLHIRAPKSPEGLRDGRVVVVMRKLGGQWRQSGDL